MKTDIMLRKVELSDRDDLFLWRNHPETIENSFSQEQISREEHNRWFKEKLFDNNTTMYMACKDSEKVGVVRFEQRAEMIRVSVMVNPTFRNKGYGASIIKAATEHLLIETKTIKPLIAEIKMKNIPSIKVFERAGYRASFMAYVFRAEDKSL